MKAFYFTFYSSFLIKTCSFLFSSRFFVFVVKSGDVGNDDSWFFEAYIASSSSEGNSPMHDYLRSKTRLGAYHSDYNGVQVHYGHVGFDHSYCVAGSGSSCQVSPVRLKVNMWGDANYDDIIGLMWYTA